MTKRKLTKAEIKQLDDYQRIHKERATAIEGALSKEIADKYGEETLTLVNGIAHFVLTMESIKETRKMSDDQCAKIFIGTAEFFKDLHCIEHGELDIATMQQWHGEACEGLEIFLEIFTKRK